MVTRQEAIGRYAVLQQRNFFYEADSGDDEDLAKLHVLTGCDRKEDVSDRVIDELRRKYVGSSDDEEQQQPLQVPEKSSFASIEQFKFMGGHATHGSESLSSGPSGVPQAASESHNRDLRDDESRDSGKKAVDLSAQDGWVEQLKEKWAPLTLEQVRIESAKFAVARNWTQFHRPRNIMAALTSEAGELTEALGLWRDVGFGGKGLSPEEKHHVGEELTDCLVYLLRLADVLDVDLPQAVEMKLQKNAAKYPAHLVYGSSKKYTEYQQQANK